MDDKMMQGEPGLVSADHRFWVVAAALALIMAVTRLGHFGEYGGPVDASWAVFFLAGLWLRDLRLFPGFFLLAWITDLAAFALGTPTNCYSPAYFFLIPAYGALWISGRWAARGGYGRVVLGVAGGATVTFVIANFGMYFFVALPEAATPEAFASAVAGYFPGYLLTMIMYSAFGLLAEAGFGLRRRVMA
ncbi:MAG: hypothetical protein FJ160_01230 [Gammaproteobacteria bacterium]|nr:hypothetical protein [Gammaproteobacteria bacterium]